MPRLYLVRHGEPSGTWTDTRDPGLTDLGREQARAAADRLRLVQPKQVVSSPLRRALETSAPLAEALSMQPILAEAVAEIPSPPDVSLEKRGGWLRAIMGGEWSETEPSLRHWRDGVITYLTQLPVDTAVFSHFIAINVALGAAIGDDRVMCFRPAHASVTVLETNGRVISLVELGATAETTVR